MPCREIADKVNTQTTGDLSSRVAALLVCVNVPHDVIRQTEDAISGSFGHLCEAFSFGLVLKRVAGKIDTYTSCQLAILVRQKGITPTGTMNIRLHQNTHTSNAV